MLHRQRQGVQVLVSKSGQSSEQSVKGLNLGDGILHSPKRLDFLQHAIQIEALVEIDLPENKEKKNQDK